MVIQERLAPFINAPSSIVGGIDHSNQWEIMFHVSRNNHRTFYPFMSSISPSISAISRRSVHETGFTPLGLAIIEKGAGKPLQPSPSQAAPGQGNVIEPAESFHLQ
jgi:hypothetical protein